MKKEQAKKLIEKKLASTVDASPKLLNAYLLVHSDQLNIHWNLAVGQTGGMPAHPDQPYHTASIGKMFTAILTAMLAEEGKFSFSDPVASYLPEELIKGLHIYRGRDYSQEIQIGHLISNTSGLPDYYEDNPKGGRPFLRMLLDEPSRVWTALETIQYTKQHLSPRFSPGNGLHYSNTGFNLLGLMIEAVTGKPYHEVLHHYIFQRLGMDHSYLSQFSRPAVSSPFPVAYIYSLDGPVDPESIRSFSSIYASGQTVSTSRDLLLFMKALAGNQLLGPDTFSTMQRWRKLWLGVDYGYGVMRVRMLPFTQKYHVWGHLGSIASFMLYNPAMDVYVIGNFNTLAYLRQSIQFVFQVLRTVSKCGDE